MQHPWWFGIVTALLCALLGVAIGVAAGAYWVSRMDCSGGVTCEGTAYVAPAFGFFGFWIGLVVGVVGSIVSVIWMRKTDSADG
jgi:hypothetical protein